MIRPSRVAAIAEMQGRDLARRHLALALLVALPLAFYGSLAGHDVTAVIPGGVAMAFSVAGASIFSVHSARAVDQRLVLAGFRPSDLIMGRVVVLEALALPVVGGTAAIMAIVSSPPRPWILGLAVGMVAFVAVPFGLAIGALVPRELEATLVLICVVGIQLSLGGSETLAKFLPFWGPRRLIDVALGESFSVFRMVAVSLGYAAALFVASIILMTRRVRVIRHSQLG